MAARRAGTVRGRRDNRNSAIPAAYAPPDQSISESVSESSPAASRDLPDTGSAFPDVPAPAVQPISTAPAVAPAQSSPGFGQVAASTFSPFSPQAQQPQLPSPLASDARAAPSIDHSKTETQSIRSATTTTSQGGLKHPELHEPGLNSSIIETVNARFENGKLQTSSVIGDIALAYNQGILPSSESEKIRLENFTSLEKVAPNPAFITPSQSTEGEYTINLSGLSGKSQVAFKYQVRLDSTTTSHAPLLITPAFRPEANQFSAIIQYSLNPSYPLPSGVESVTLSNVTLAFTLEGAKASSCQTKPSGTFIRDKNLIFWQLNEVSLTPGATPQKLLARFATDAQASGGVVEARWEVSGDAARGVGSGLGVSMAGSTGGASGGPDPFADEDGQPQSGGEWKALPGVRKVGSGSYVAR